MMGSGVEYLNNLRLKTSEVVDMGVEDKHIFLNLFRANITIPEKVPGYYVSFEALSEMKERDRYAKIQRIVNKLNSINIDCAIVPKNLFESYDIVILNPTAKKIEFIKKKCKKLVPKMKKTEDVGKAVIKKAWQNRIRSHLVKKGYLKIGDQYVPKEDIVTGDRFKQAFRVQATILHGRPAIYLDPKTKIMEPLSDEVIDVASKLGNESEIKVRVLPDWYEGILLGRENSRVKDRFYPYWGKKLRCDEYWKIKHEIDFVKPDEELLKVYVPTYNKTLSYPRSCVFLEFKKRSSLPSNLKKNPQQRVKESLEFLEQIQPVTFLGFQLRFSISSVHEVGFKSHTYTPDIYVLVGNGKKVPIKKVSRALRDHGPYAGAISGKYVVVYPDTADLEVLKKAMNNVQRVYSNLKLGELKVATEIDGGFVCVGGSKVTDYTSTILELRKKMNSSDILAVVVLPDEHYSEIYYESRNRLFERIFGLNPVRSQCVFAETMEEIVNNSDSAYPISANIASQCYVKLGGTGSAVWVLDEPADSPIKGIKAGTSCYAYYDVSRRLKKKASASAYSALTDSYGRFIATGSKPVGGEGLTPSTFYDIIVEILEKVSMFNKMYKKVSNEKYFEFKRLVFAKDGVIRQNEARMMEEVIYNGIPEEGKDPIEQVLKNSEILPDQLVIDIISVNKSPNKRIFEYNGSYENVRVGTAISFNEKSGLLVSASTRLGTIQPLELTLHSHICLNIDVPEPHISEIMDEYYRLTYLNWASLFNQGKYALPQILTQKLGENISAGLTIPDDLILL